MPRSVRIRLGRNNVVPPGTAQRCDIIRDGLDSCFFIGAALSPVKIDACLENGDSCSRITDFTARPPSRQPPLSGSIDSALFEEFRNCRLATRLCDEAANLGLCDTSFTPRQFIRNGVFIGLPSDRTGPTARALADKCKTDFPYFQKELCRSTFTFPIGDPRRCVNPL